MHLRQRTRTRYLSPWDSGALAPNQTGSPAAVPRKGGRPVALRPRLSTGLPLSEVVFGCSGHADRVCLSYQSAASPASDGPRGPPEEFVDTFDRGEPTISQRSCVRAPSGRAAAGLKTDRHCPPADVGATLDVRSSAQLSAARRLTGTEAGTCRDHTSRSSSTRPTPASSPMAARWRRRSPTPRRACTR
jgi:hypothetical protein